MFTCDSRDPDEINNWMGYEYMDAYATAAEQYLEQGERESAFYMIRAALNHLSTQRWPDAPSQPCNPPADSKDNDFFEYGMHPGLMRLWHLIIESGFADGLSTPYPNLFPMETPFSE